MKRPNIKKICTVFILVIFIANMIVPDHAYPETGSARRPETGSVRTFDPEDLFLPVALGYVDDIHKGDTGKVVFHIKDAHCNYDAQRSISGLIDWIVENYGVNLVNLEGGMGDYDLGIFEKIGDVSVKRSVSDEYLKKGRINGAEFYRIFNPEKVNLKGIEDPFLYDRNLMAFKGLLGRKKETEEFLRTTGEVLERMRDKYFNGDLKTFDANRVLFDRNRMELGEYISYLLGTAGALSLEVSGWENMRLMSGILAREKGIDFKAAGREREELVGCLAERLSWFERSRLLRRVRRFSAGRMPEHDFYAFLVRKAGKVGIEKELYPDFMRYSEYLSVCVRVNEIFLFGEIRDAEEDLGEALCGNDTERELLSHLTRVRLLEKMFSLTMDRRELAAAGNEACLERMLVFAREHGVPDDICRRMEETSVHVSNGFSGMLLFYALAGQRDRVFARNIMDNMREAGVKTGIVVTGGFHSDDLCRILKEQGVSYVSVTPAFTNALDYVSPYMGLLTGAEGAPHGKVYALLASTIQLRSLWSEFSNRDFIEALAMKIQAIVDIEKEKGTPEILIHISEHKKMFFMEKMQYEPVLWNPVYPAGPETRREVSAEDLMASFLAERDMDLSEFFAAAPKQEANGNGNGWAEDTDLVALLKLDIKQSRYGPARLAKKMAYTRRRDGRMIKREPDKDETYVFNYDVRTGGLTGRDNSAKTITGYMLHPSRVRGRNEKFYLCSVLSHYFRPGITEDEQRDILTGLLEEQAEYEGREECGWRWLVDRDENGDIEVDQDEGLGLRGLHIFDRTKLPKGISVPTLKDDADTHGGIKNVQEMHYEVEPMPRGKVKIRLSTSWTAVQEMNGLQRSAYTDQLSGLYNRHYFNQVIKPDLPAKVPVSILFIDADHFKRFNDTYAGGHDFGDMILKAIANALEASVRKGEDHVIRWGGEEFVVILPNKTEEEAKEVARRILKKIKSMGKKARLELGAWKGSVGLREDDSLSVTTGIVEVSSSVEAERVDDYIAKADAAMIEAKRKNQRGRIFIVGKDPIPEDAEEIPEGEEGELAKLFLVNEECYFWQYRDDNGDVIRFPSFRQILQPEYRGAQEDWLFGNKFGSIKDLLEAVLNRVEEIFTSPVETIDVFKDGGIYVIAREAVSPYARHKIAGEMSMLGYLTDWFSRLALRMNRFPAEQRCVVYPVYSEAAFAREMEMVNMIKRRLAKGDYGFSLMPLPYLAGSEKSRGEAVGRMEALAGNNKDTRSIIFADEGFFEKNNKILKNRYGDRVMCIKEEGLYSEMEGFTHVGFTLRSALALLVIDYFDPRNGLEDGRRERVKDIIASLLVLITGDSGISEMFMDDPEDLVKGLIVLRPAERISWQEVGKKVEATRRFLKSL